MRVFNCGSNNGWIVYNNGNSDDDGDDDDEDADFSFFLLYNSIENPFSNIVLKKCSIKCQYCCCSCCFIINTSLVALVELFTDETVMFVVMISHN